MNLYALLQSRFPADRSAPCLLLPDGDDVSYGALEDGVGRLAVLLAAKGVGVGDRVAVQTAKSPQAVMLYLATLQIGAVFLPLNPAYTAAEIDYFLKDAEPALFVTDAQAVARETDALSPRRDIYDSQPDDLAALVYTSGTTGRAKGAMLSHHNLASNALALHAAWGFSSADVLLHALPIFHVHGLFVAIHCALLSGAPMLWLPRFEEDAVLAALPRATVMMGVPTFYGRLLADPRLTAEAAAHMRLFISGSAPLLESVFDAFEARIGQRILERYGMSEAQMITTNPLEGERLAGSVGFPLPGVSVRIAGGAETGVVEIAGPSVTAGYWRNPEKTAQAFADDGFFITGDIGLLDADGRLWLSGRANDLIISGGLNVYPKEVELVLDELAGVIESAVIGVPHADFGEAVVAVIAGAGDEAEVIRAARERLAAFKAPKRVIFVEDLPRNAMGKVEKAALRRAYANLFT
jgi:malonyl-CoA/methylmalonyl-CoA synthetase